jgi:hypothetical protein
MKHNKIKKCYTKSKKSARMIVFFVQLVKNSNFYDIGSILDDTALPLSKDCFFSK